MRAAVFLLFAACAGPDDVAEDCATPWSVGVVGEGGARVSDGALVLSAVDPVRGESVDVSQGPLEGDFEVIVAFEDFDPLGPGGFLRADIEPEDPSAAGASAMLQVDPISFLLVDSGEEDGGIEAQGDHAGSFAFLRTGSSLTVTAIGIDSEVSAEGAFEGPANLTLTIGTWGSTYAGEMSVRITEVTVHGGGGTLATDTFACDSVAR